MFEMSHAKEIVEKLLNDEAVHNLRLYEKLKLIMENNNKLGSFISNSRQNTDNAWIEYTVYNYHDPNGTALENVLLKVS